MNQDVGFEGKAFVLRDKNYGPHSLQPQFRQQVKKSSHRCEVARIDWATLSRSALPVNRALRLRGRERHSGMEARGVFTAGELLAYMVVLEWNGFCYGLQMNWSGSHPEWHPTHLFYYETRGKLHSGAPFPTSHIEMHALLVLERVNTNSQALENEGEDDKTGKEDIEFVETTEDAAVAFEAPKESFDLVAAAVSDAVIRPRVQALGIGRHHGFVAQFLSQCPRFISFVSAIHQELATWRRRSAGPKEFAPVRGITGLPRREFQHQGTPSIRGNQMNLGGAASTGAPDRLRTVFLEPRCHRDEL